jgi:hypothetical protein
MSGINPHFLRRIQKVEYKTSDPSRRVRFTWSWRLAGGFAMFSEWKNRRRDAGATKNHAHPATRLEDSDLLGK